jgi:hypothetical protein
LFLVFALFAPAAGAAESPDVVDVEGVVLALDASKSTRSLAESYPFQASFEQVYRNLRAWSPLPVTAAPA